MDAEISQITDGGPLSGGGNDLEATEVEFASKCVAYAIAATSWRILGRSASWAGKGQLPGDEDGPFCISHDAHLTTASLAGRRCLHLKS